MIKKSSPPQIEPWHPTPEQEKQIRRTDATFEWLSQQSGEFFLPYAGRYIAARDREIIAAGESDDALIDQLEKDQICLQDVLIHYVRKPGWTIYR
jgi:hypothetical protein